MGISYKKGKGRMVKSYYKNYPIKDLMAGIEEVRKGNLIMYNCTLVTNPVPNELHFQKSLNMPNNGKK